MTFLCVSCGHRSPRWMGFCPGCGSSEPLTEVESPRRIVGPPPVPVPVDALSASASVRIPTGISELDRVLGGGIVPGSVMLLGGEPGVGKSTLLLQLAGAMADSAAKVLVVTAEESAEQVALRASRLGVGGDNVLLLAEQDVGRALAAAEDAKPDLLVVDSIQTVATASASSAPGTVTQVREAAGQLVRFAKDRGVATAIVGHVTKDGGLAGPKLLEHMVDVVMYLEGDPDRGFRALRSLKNRFGATHVVALFDMRSDGLVVVDDPSAAFLADWQASVPGTVVFPAVEGRRSVLVEIQALVAPTRITPPRRSVRGVEAARIHQILAVIDRHARMATFDREVFVNVVGGWRLAEPACDLPVLLAIVSSLLDVPLGSTAAWGEVGLAGEVRPVPFDARRREEAERLGVERVIAPHAGGTLRVGDALALSGLTG